MDIEQKRLLVKRKLAKQKLMSQGNQQPAQEATIAPGATISAPLSGAGPDGQDIPWNEMGTEFNEQLYASDAPPNWAVAGETLSRDVPSNILGAPSDIASLLVNAVKGGGQLLMGQGDQPFNPVELPLGSDFFRENVFREVADKDTYTKGQKRASSIAGLGVEALAGGAGLASKAKQIEKLGPFAADMVEPYLKNAGSQLAKDAASGVGAGVGMETADGMGFGPIGQMFGMLLGGLGGAKSMDTVTGAYKAPMEILDNRRTVQMDDGGGDIKRGVQKSAARQLQSATQDPLLNVTGGKTTPAEMSATLQKNIDRNAADGIEGQTTAQMTDNFVLSGLENNQRVRNQVPFREQDMKLKESVTNKVRSLAPEDADVEAPQRIARQYGDEQLSGAQEGVDGARQQRYDLERQAQQVDETGSEIIAPVEAQRGQKGAASRQIDKDLTETLGERTETKNKAFEDAAEGSYVDAESFLQSVKNIEAEQPKLSLSDRNEFGRLKKKIAEFIPKSGTLEGPNSTAGSIPSEEVIKLRRSLNNKMREAEVRGDYDAKEAYGKLKKQINETFENDPNFKDANDNYKENYAPFFAEGRGKIYRDNKYRGDGTGKSDPDKIADIFLDDTRDAARDLSRIIEIGDTPENTVKAVEKYMSADLASKLGDKLNPRLVRNWIDDNADKLDEFPEVKAKFEQLQADLGSNRAKANETQIEIKKAADAIRDAEKNLSATQSRINRGVLGGLIKKDPDKYIKSIRTGDDRLQQIDEALEIIGDNEEGLAGFKKAYIDDIVATSTDVDGNLTLSKMSKVDQDAMGKILDAEEMNTLRRMGKILEGQRKLNVSATAGSNTADKLLNKGNKAALKAYLKLKYGMLKGGGIMSAITDGLDMLPGKAEKVDNLLSRAMLDPKVAKMLLDTDVSEVTTKWNKELTAAIASNAAYRSQDDDE